MPCSRSASVPAKIRTIPTTSRTTVMRSEARGARIRLNMFNGLPAVVGGWRRLSYARTRASNQSSGAATRRRHLANWTDVTKLLKLSRWAPTGSAGPVILKNHNWPAWGTIATRIRFFGPWKSNRRPSSPETVTGSPPAALTSWIGGRSTWPRQRLMLASGSIGPIAVTDTSAGDPPPGTLNDRIRGTIPPVLPGSRTQPAGVVHFAIGPAAGSLPTEAEGCAAELPGTGG